jgi:CRP/FNR family transcriptional regulator, cyclic AMP receptor protein
MNALMLDPGSLRTQSLFSSFTERQLTGIVPAVKHRSYGAGSAILRAGDVPEGLYVLLSGRAKVVHEDGQGRMLITAYVGPNEFFGEMGLLDGKAYPATVQAIEQCEVAFVPRKTFLDCICDNAPAALYVLQKVLERLAAAHDKMASLALSNVYTRVARVLLENGRQTESGWRVKPGAEEIAALVGASREMVSRVVKGMISAGVVRREKRKLVVTDRQALASSFSRSCDSETSPVRRCHDLVHTV